MKVHFYATLRAITGEKTVDFETAEGLTAGELLNAIVIRFPALRKELLNEAGHLHGHVHFLINGRDLQFLSNDLNTRLTPEDVINVFPAVGGG